MAHDFSPDLLDATQDTALDALARAGSEAEALVSAWVARANAGAVLTASEDATGPARTAARRGLNVLRARRVAIPPRARVARLEAASDSDDAEARFMAPDPNGTMLLVLRAGGSGRAKTAIFFLRVDGTILRVDTAELSRSQLGKRLDQLLPGRPYEPIVVSVDWARARIATARRRHAATRVPEPLGMTNALSLLTPAPAVEPPHPLDAAGVPRPTEDVAELLADSYKLHDLPEIRGWLPPKPLVDQLLLAVGRTVTPGAAPDAAALRATLRAAVIQATDRYFTPAASELLIGMLKDAALSVLGREGARPVQQILVVIDALGQAGLITNPPHEIPFCRAFFDKALGVLASRTGGQLQIPIPQAQPGLGASGGAGEPGAPTATDGDEPAMTIEATATDALAGADLAAAAPSDVPAVVPAGDAPTTDGARPEGSGSPEGGGAPEGSG